MPLADRGATNAAFCLEQAVRLTELHQHTQALQQQSAHITQCTTPRAGTNSSTALLVAVRVPGLLGESDTCSLLQVRASGEDVETVDAGSQVCAHVQRAHSAREHSRATPFSTGVLLCQEDSQHVRPKSQRQDGASGAQESEYIARRASASLACVSLYCADKHTCVTRLLQSKNPAFPGSTLYKIFEVQAWLSIAVGGLLAFNVLLPTDEPSIPRLVGMWSVWMFAVPSLRARDCPKREKDALNILFLAIPLVNVALPFVWKSFGAAFAADVALMAALYISNGALEGFPDLPEEQGDAMQPPPPPPPPSQ